MQGFCWKENITPWSGSNLVAGLDYDTTYGSVTQTSPAAAFPFFPGDPTPVNPPTVKTNLPTFKLTSPIY